MISWLLQMPVMVFENTLPARTGQALSLQPHLVGFIRPTPAMQIEAGVPLRVTLDGTDAAMIAYASGGSETVRLFARAAASDTDAPPLDVVMEVISPDGQRIAYNDDYAAALIPAATVTSLNLQPTDAVIPVLTLDASGEYLIRVNSFNGVSVGEAEVTLEIIEPVSIERGTDDDAVLAANDMLTATVTLRPDQVAVLDIALEAGKTYTLTVRDPRAILDPVAQLSDADGKVLASNDDHTSADFGLNIFDSRITDFTPTESGDYVLSVRDYLARGGTFQVEVRITD